ncbi:hypothetical protein [Denitromonas sp.]|uniref:hypothetical protein n=1 Tax=Denitromonas sp. TaxID=2734609 RepID=UPI003A83B03C
MIVDENGSKDLLRPEVSEVMERTSEQLCALKVSLDRYARQWMGQAFLDDWMDWPRGNTCAYDGHTFLWLILPFMNWERDEPEDYYRAYVNPRHVLGASIKGWPEDIPEGKVAGRIAGYATHFGSRDNACYIRYPTLGLYWAHEGKHRVAFMRAHDQSVIAAWVRDASYPQSERIVVIAPTDERDEWVALLDGRYLQVLRRPRVTVQILNAYGVKTVRWKEVTGLPDEQRVRQTIYARRLHRAPNSMAEWDRTLDLEDVRQQQQKEAASVDRTIHELAPLRFVWRRYFAAVAACLAAGLVLSAIQVDWVRQIGWMLLGGASGLTMGLTLLRLRGPRYVALDSIRQ